MQLNIRVTAEEKAKIHAGASQWHAARVRAWQGGGGSYPGHVVDVARFMRETLLRRVDELAGKPAKKPAKKKPAKKVRR